MNETRGVEEETAGPSGSGYVRLPAPLVALGLVVFLGVLLAFGLYANANLRPQGIVVPTPAAVSTAATATALPVAAAPLPTTTAVPSAPPTVVATETAVALPAPTADGAATAQPTPPGTIPVSDTPQASVTGSPQATVRPTVEPTLAAEVGAAYQKYWQVRAEALYDLDTSHLQEVMGGEHLADAETLIGQLRDQGQTIKTSVSHQYVVLDASDESANVADSYIDNSIYVDAVDHTELTKPTGMTLNELYSMNRLDGQWKVVRLSRSTQ